MLTKLPVSRSPIHGMSDEEAMAWLRLHPISGGDGSDEDDSDDDESEDGDEDKEGKDKKDGDRSGKGGKSKPEGKQGKLYTKEELDDVVEKAVTDRLKRKERADARKSAGDKGEYETLSEELQREIDEEWKPKVEEAEKLTAHVEELETVIHEQVDSILAELPQELQDLDLGEDEDPVKRLRWLTTKVLPKSRKQENDAERERKPKGSNPPGPAPRGKQGEDSKKKIPAPVSRKRF